jgi:hypothetical protein
VLGALMLTGCTTNTAIIVPVIVGQPSGRIPLEFAVASGKRTMLRRVFALHADCSLGAYASMRPMTQPLHGTLTIEQGRFYPSYPPGDQRYACNLKPQAGVAVFYQSDPGYVGPDGATIEVVRPNGGNALLDYHLDVK